MKLNKYNFINMEMNILQKVIYLNHAHFQDISFFFIKRKKEENNHTDNADISIL